MQTITIFTKQEGNKIWPALLHKGQGKLGNTLRT